MTRQDFLLSLDELLELPPGTLTGEERLEDLEQWNSMAMVAYMALAQSKGGVKVSPRQIAACTTVSDLVALGGGNAPARTAGAQSLQ
jgi:hypothetical protein